MTDYASQEQVSWAAYYNGYCMVTICSSDNKTPSIPEAITPLISGETGAVIPRSSEYFSSNDFAQSERATSSQPISSSSPVMSPFFWKSSGV